MGKISVKIGCSGFSNSNWKGFFYPEELKSAEFLNFYAKEFNAVEVNSTFYHKPRISTLEKWYAETPTGFSFMVKVPKNITHVKRFVDAETDILEFVSLIKDSLKDKLLGFLFQLPPSFKYSEENIALVKVCAKLGEDFYFEFRHESWWEDDVEKELQQGKINKVSVSSAKLPDSLFENENIYFRLHGKERMFYSEYSVEYLKKLASEIETSKAKKVFIFFNNTASSAAIINAKEMQKLLY